MIFSKKDLAEMRIRIRPDRRCEVGGALAAAAQAGHLRLAGAPLTVDLRWHDRQKVVLENYKCTISQDEARLQMSSKESDGLRMKSSDLKCELRLCNITGARGLAEPSRLDAKNASGNESRVAVNVPAVAGSSLVSMGYR